MSTTDKELRDYREALLLALRMREVPGDRIGEILAEVESHVAESGEDPIEAFGPPREYAASLTHEHRPTPWWRTATIAVLAGAAGLGVGQGALAVLLGETWLGRSGWLWLAVGLVLSVPVALMVRGSTEVRDPRTGEPVVRTPWWAPVALVGLPVAIVLAGWLAVELGR